MANCADKPALVIPGFRKASPQCVVRARQLTHFKRSVVNGHHRADKGLSCQACRRFCQLLQWSNDSPNQAIHCPEGDDKAASPDHDHPIQKSTLGFFERRDFRCTPDLLTRWIDAIQNRDVIQAFGSHGFGHTWFCDHRRNIAGKFGVDGSGVIDRQEKTSIRLLNPMGVIFARMPDQRLADL